MSETGTETADANPELIGTVSAIVTATALAFVVYTLFESTLLIAVVAVLSAAGSYLMLPYFLRLDEDAERGDGGGNFHPGAAGIALESSSIVIIALMMAFEDPLLAVAGGLALAAGEYAVTSRVLPHAWD